MTRNTVAGRDNVEPVWPPSSSMLRRNSAEQLPYLSIFCRAASNVAPSRVLLPHRLNTDLKRRRTHCAHADYLIIHRLVLHRSTDASFGKDFETKIDERLDVSCPMAPRPE